MGGMAAHAASRPGPEGPGDCFGVALPPIVFCCGGMPSRPGEPGRVGMVSVRLAVSCPPTSAAPGGLRREGMPPIATFAGVYPRPRFLLYD